METVFNELYEKLYAAELHVFAEDIHGRNTAAKAREITETEKADVFTAAFSLGLRIGAGVFGKTARTPFAVG